VQTKQRSVKLLVFLFLATLTPLLAEIGARLLLRPSDFLGVGMIRDQILGGVPSQTAKAEFDAWGYRNQVVPVSADIVAVGDSHTFGNAVGMKGSWPFQLGTMLGKNVYNMGMGGYGPNQYYYLSTTKALSLKPKVIIWGLYLGDNFENAYTITYGLDYWAYMRKLSVDKATYSDWTERPRPSRLKRVRIWLSEHSLLYQLLFHAGWGGRLQGEEQIRNAARLYPGEATSLSVPDKHILEAFWPEGSLIRLDQNSPAVLEGMRITFELLGQMNEICRKNHVQFVVVVIPIKEAVFSEYLEHNPKLPLSNVIDSLLENDREARAKTFQFLSNSGIPYVDPLPELKASVDGELYDRTAADMHPSKNGYRVIAEAVFEAYERNSWGRGE
jgi:hypothetical protein